MGHVPVRELNRHTANVIARVEAGEQIEVIRNGTTVAVIAPASPHPLAALVNSGELRRAPNRGDRVQLLQIIIAGGPYVGSAGLDAILEDRYGGDRLRDEHPDRHPPPRPRATWMLRSPKGEPQTAPRPSAAGSPRLQRDQRYRGEEATLIELARRGEPIYPELDGLLNLSRPPLD